MYIKLIVATNHLSFVNEYILNTFNNVFDSINISANTHETKPNKEFHIKILEELNLYPDEILFLDDSLQNIQGSINCGIKAIHVTKNTNILEQIQNYL